MPALRSRKRLPCGFSIPAALFLFLLLQLATTIAHAHPLVENVLDIVVSPGRITIDAKIATEEISLTGPAKSPSAQEWPQTLQAHAAYLRAHIHLTADNIPVETVSATLTDTPASRSPLVSYRLIYVLKSPPASVRIQQTLLQEFDGWTASCIVRYRQSTNPDFDMSLLLPNQTGNFNCTWDPASQPATGNAQTTVRLWPTLTAYATHGIMHILTGWDHLLFVSALVLAARNIWDLIKVVTAFTVAHTLTLTLCVLNLVTLSEHVVEPMIAASIVFVAVQNILYPRQSCGWTGLAVAFGFGLFHGLGFAGGLRDAMIAMPAAAFWTALIGFSLGVEIGHQIVVIPLYVLLPTLKRLVPKTREFPFPAHARTFASLLISLAGVYYLLKTLS